MAPRGTKAEKGATLVMETNSSSIVSKRSVERLYYPEPHFFRHFVKKPQRRSPLINRGYWLRMHAVETSVRKFLEEPSELLKVVVNLGCGFDPLPFQFLSRDRTLCQNVKFVDVDHHKLMVKKRDVINQCTALSGLLSDAQLLPESGSVLLRSKEYVAAGCDLGDLNKLDVALKDAIGLTEVSILFIAEVSLTYMEVSLADALIQFLPKLSNDVNFCLLEQYFPDGPNHPFAVTMMKHFLKLQSPLHSIHRYPSLDQQEMRFRESGWTTTKSTNLWELWSDPTFLTEEQRLSLDSVEVFDEWEEFALFASHYFLLSASSRNTATGSTLLNGTEVPNVEPILLTLAPLCPPKFSGQRRFGAIVPTTAKSFGLHGGLGPQTRLSSTDEYTSSRTGTAATGEMPPLINMESRMCHTITQFDGHDCLLVGGRASPRDAMADCWIRRAGQWRRTDNLPTPRYRHCATAVDLGEGNSHVLIYGGRCTSGEVLNDFLLWNEMEGWRAVNVTNQSLPARFGASIANIDRQSGILLGGMTRDGVVLNDFWIWKLTTSSSGNIRLELNNLTENLLAGNLLHKWLGRFGASVTTTERGTFIIGGIAKHNCIPQDYDIMLLSNHVLKDMTLSPDRSFLTAVELGSEFNRPRPLLVGHSSCATCDGDVLIVGGGAVCFSFGVHWNEGTWLLQSARSETMNSWTLHEQAASPEVNPLEGVSETADVHTAGGTTEMQTIPRVSISSAREFQIIVDNAKPVILSDLNIGSCRTAWTKEYLEKAIGRDRKVVVHESKSSNMNFQTKNFAYVTKEFGTFLDEVYTNESKQYLRSISSTNPSEHPTNLARDFPGLQNDFYLPPELSLVSENAHSSPLRISGPVILWLHYDVLANVLCQIQGHKRLILYPPADITHLSFPPGSSNSSITLFKNLTDTTPLSPPNTHPFSALLKPGDVLFIPPLWLHTANPTDGEVSVAVNVFFRNLDKGYAAGRDVYGNRDLQAYERGRAEVEKIARAFDGVPRDIARFYIERLADELRGKARG
ncbi:hypothetical protein GX48_00604 [Paracoccidioides brasiliensis]|nr:hypothetical protein GX48_00604 [Paracoccidioides brasiliensis]